MTTIVSVTPLFFDIPVHDWIMMFGIFSLIVSSGLSLWMAGWLEGNRKYHKFLIQRSKERRVFFSIS